MDEPVLPQPNSRTSSVRRLKIEAEGDSWKGRMKPKIRLTGRWLERAGFHYGQRVEVKSVADGVIELRMTVNESPTATQ